MAQYTAGRRGRTVPHEQALAVQVRRRLQDRITPTLLTKRAIFMRLPKDPSVKNFRLFRLFRFFRI